MKPLKLTLSAFGSYIDKTVINFEKLGESGIYLITGDTGSGKTTIFDAITYALYGSGSGDLRSDDRLFRSEYADLKTETYVEFEFLYKNNIYKIRRNPEYERAAKRGTGTTVQKAEHILECPDGRVITYQKEINEYITNLLGINENQFKQIVMLPQGAFMKFLMADTKDKRRIFAEIFKTHLYSILQDRIKENARLSKEKIDKIKELVLHSVNEIICPSTSEYYESIKRLKNADDDTKVYTYNNTLEVIEKIENEQNVYITEIKNNLNSVNLKIDKVNENLGIHKTNEQLKSIIEKNISELKVAEEKLNILSDELDKARNDAKNITDIELELNIVESQFRKYEQKDSLLLQYKKIKSDYSTANNQIETINNKISIDTEKIEKMKKSKEDIILSENEEIELNNKLHDNKSSIEKINAINEVISDYESETQKLNNKQREFAILRQQYEHIKNEYTEKETLFDNSIAGILAEKLRKNMPCPVCGSENHPVLAKKPANTPTQEELDKCKLDLDRIEQQKNDCRNQIISLEGKSEVLLENIKKNSNMILNENMEEIEKLKEILKTKQYDLDKEKNSIELQILNIQKLKKKLIELDEEIKKIQNEVAESENKKNEISLDISKIKETIASLKAQIDSIELKFDNLDEAKKYTQQLKSNINALKNKLDLATENFEKCNKYISECKTAVKTAEQQINNTVIPSKDELEIKIIQLKEEQEDIIHSITDIKYIIENNKNIRNTIKKAGNNIEKELEEYKWIKELSDLVNGTVKNLGVEQLSLEVRIQMIYFRQIIKKANVHLLKMTNGQYELIRAEEVLDNRKKTGLDLNVYDHYSQSERNIKTLSGGESFMASLALAFGMSDEIQSSSGGVQIDTMFIDEGFGSLDDEALNQAVNMLSSLVQNNRLIGIISHVSELQNRIEKKIIVTKDKIKGSKIRIEC